MFKPLNEVVYQFFAESLFYFITYLIAKSGNLGKTSTCLEDIERVDNLSCY